ncbi:MAG: hypothetical protein K2N14_03980 [Clostridia bacterium]|nr:hypothetical protein [Clostridia bacterium]
MEDIKCCKNCKFYIAHYIKEKRRFKTICGHCTNNQKSVRFKSKTIMPCDLCEYWEHNNNKTIEQSNSVRAVIFEIHEQLTKILEILENEE